MILFGVLQLVLRGAFSSIRLEVNSAKYWIKLGLKHFELVHIPHIGADCFCSVGALVIEYVLTVTKYPLLA